jgi:hypothetical protein
MEPGAPYHNIFFRWFLQNQHNGVYQQPLDLDIATIVFVHSLAHMGLQLIFVVYGWIDEQCHDISAVNHASY